MATDTARIVDATVWMFDDTRQELWPKANQTALPDVPHRFHRHSPERACSTLISIPLLAQPFHSHQCQRENARPLLHTPPP